MNQQNCNVLTDGAISANVLIKKLDTTFGFCRHVIDDF